MVLRPWASVTNGTTGRMAIYMEACKTTVNSERNPKLGDGEDIHPQLRSVDNLHVESPTSRVVSSLLATAQKTDLLKVLRWKPRLVWLLEAPYRKVNARVPLL